MIGDKEVRKYLETVGKRGLGTLKTITDLRPMVEALETELGQAFLKDDITNHSALINRIYESLIKEGKAEQKDVIHLQLLHGRILNIYNKLQIYQESVKKVKEAKIK